eukprot:12310289-Heterocapsa_arctica.AAC.1
MSRGWNPGGFPFSVGTVIRKVRGAGAELCAILNAETGCSRTLSSSPLRLPSIRSPASCCFCERLARQSSF